MKGKSLWWALLFAVLTAIGHFLAIEFFLYWRWQWFDVITHILGGLSIGSAAFWLGEEVVEYFHHHVSQTVRKICYVLLTFLIIFGWEAFEYYFQLTDTRMKYFWATGKDVISTFVGALLALYFLKIK
jgi:Co/Zn/Cd efflux system component